MNTNETSQETVEITDPFEAAIPARYLEAFVQKNSLTYENKWRRMLAKKGAPEKMGWAVSWNWWAFLFFLPWLFYRKLYKAAAIMIGLTILLSIWEVVIGKDLTASLFWFGLVSGLFGNAWYFSRTRKAIAAAESSYQEPDKIERALREQGGTSWLALASGLLILIVINLITTMVRDPEFWSAFMRGVHGGA